MRRNWTCCLLFTFSAATLTARAEGCAKVVSIGVCWSGFNAVVAQMDNGDKLYLGNLSDELGRARLSIGLSAQASQENVCYQVQSTSTYCAAPRGVAEWWVQGRPLF